MNVNFEHYKTFYHVAKYKNLTIAAKEMHSNQPNVSRTIKILEQQMGCKLITRKSKGIDLTPEGERLYFHVEKAIHQFIAAESEISTLSNPRQASVTVGVSETAAYTILLPALNAFRKEYPNIKVKILSHNTSTAVDLVKQGLVDFSIASLFSPVDEPLKSTTVYTYSDLLIGGPSFKDMKNPLSLQDISKLPLISLTKNTATYNFYNDLFSKSGIPFTPIYEVETTGQLCPMLIYDLGVAFIPSIYVQNSLKQKTVFQLTLNEKLPTRKICIVENRTQYTNIAAQKLKEFCMVPREYFSF